jgi:Endoribonuclease L-PSP
VVQKIISDVPAKLDVPLSHAIRAGDFVYTAGQIAVRADGSLVIGDFEAETRAVLDNVRAAIELAGGTLADQLTDGGQHEGVAVGGPVGRRRGVGVVGHGGRVPDVHPLVVQVSTRSRPGHRRAAPARRRLQRGWVHR